MAPGERDFQTNSITGFLGFFPSRTRITSSAAPQFAALEASIVSAPKCGVKRILSSGSKGWSPPQRLAKPDEETR